MAINSAAAAASTNRRLVGTIRGEASSNSRLVRKIRSWGVRGQSMDAATAVSWSSSSGIRRLLDPCPEPGQRSGEPRLDRALGDAERAGRLLDVQLEEEPAGDHAAVLFREPVDHGQQAPSLVQADGHRLGGWGRIP